MKIKLLGKNLDDIRRELKNFPIEEVETGFDFIITHGGDGALLGAEREYPGIPKFALRDAATAPTCSRHSLHTLLDDFCNGRLEISELPKLEAKCSSGTLTAVNDLFLHNLERCSALRYQVAIDGEIYAKEVLGDGACMASVHGSTAYYRSITRSIFRVGIGLAFSNSTEEPDHLVLDSSSTVELTVIRGPGIVIADNSPVQLPVQVGETVTFRQSDRKAYICGLDTFMCQDCRKLRHQKL